jgi:hypothetical protein
MLAKTAGPFSAGLRVQWLMTMKIGANTMIWNAGFTTADLPLIDKVSAMGFDVIEILVTAAEPAFDPIEPRAANKGFNAVNGNVFRWRYMWEKLAGYFGVDVAPYPGHEEPLAERFKNIGGELAKIVQKHGLRDLPIEKVAPWWHVDIDFCRAIECVTDMSRSPELGFLTYQNTRDSFKDLFARLKAEKIIP